MSKICKNLKRHIRHTYIFKCDTFNVVKVGISSDPLKRLVLLNKDAKGHTFKLVLAKEFTSSEACRAFEKYIHTRFECSRVTTGRYSGYTEIFNIEILPELLEIFNSIINIRRIDPYVTLRSAKGLESLPLFKQYGDIYRMIIADLYLAKVNGFSAIYCSKNFSHYTGKRVRYLRAFNLLSKDTLITCESLEDILLKINLDSIIISYRDRMLDFIKEAPLTSMIYTASVMEYFSTKRDRVALFKRILRGRSLTNEEIDAMQVAYKQVMKTDMNCRLEVK